MPSVRLRGAPRIRLRYLQYLGRHPYYGDTVLVSPKLFTESREPTADAFVGGYIAFYPVRAAVAQDLVSVVGSLSPLENIPERIRRAGARSGTRVTTWIIEDATAETLKTQLSEEELQLPIGSIWSHEALVFRINTGWTPASEG